MDPNLDASAGSISLRLKYLADTLANCAAFQSLVGAANAAEALRHIWEDGLPAPTTGSQYTVSELQGMLPYALIWCEKITHTHEAEPASFMVDAELAVQLVRAVPEELRWDMHQASRQWSNTVGTIMDQMRAQASTAGRLSIATIEMAEPHYRTMTEEERSEGDQQFADLIVTVMEGI